MQRQKPSHRLRQYFIIYLDADAVGTAFSGKENNEFKPRTVETPIQVAPVGTAFSAKDNNEFKPRTVEAPIQVAPTDAAFLNPITQQEIVRPSNTIIE